MFVDGLHPITSIGNKMKNCLMELQDKILLRNAWLLKPLIDELKNMCRVEHSRHRSFGNRKITDISMERGLFISPPLFRLVLLTAPLLIF